MCSYPIVVPPTICNIKEKETVIYNVYRVHRSYLELCVKDTGFTLGLNGRRLNGHCAKAIRKKNNGTLDVLATGR